MLKTNSHKLSGGQIAESNKKVVLYCSLAELVQAMEIVSVDLMILRHLLLDISNLI